MTVAYHSDHPPVRDLFKERTDKAYKGHEAWDGVRFVCRFPWDLGQTSSRRFLRRLRAAGTRKSKIYPSLGPQRAGRPPEKSAYLDVGKAFENGICARGDMQQCRVRRLSPRLEWRNW